MLSPDNALRLAFGTLSIYPTPPPALVDRRVAGWAMALAPLVGVLLAAPLWLVSEVVQDRWSPFLLAVVWVAGLAVLTRGMHLDGLADTADGLGSRKPREVALEVMRKSDVGPFGVATIVLVLLLQVAASSQLLARDGGSGLLAAAVVVSRLALPLACSKGVPGARGDGLGSVVAGTVGVAQLIVALAVAGCILVGVALVGTAGTVLLAPVGLVAGLAFCWWCVRRLGGVTGDVLGAVVEVTLTAAVLVMALRLV